MRRFVRGDQCRRVILDEYMDGLIEGYEERIQCREEEAKCDVCARRDAQTAIERAARAVEEAEYQEQMRQQRG